MRSLTHGQDIMTRLKRHFAVLVVIGLLVVAVVPVASAVPPSATVLASDAEARARFGDAIAVEGDTMLVGDPFADAPSATQAGAVYVFMRDGGAWVERQKLQAADGAGYDHFGFAVALSGDWAVIGAPHADLSKPDEGKVYFFQSDLNGHFQERVFYSGLHREPEPEYPAEWDRFGWSVAIHGEVALAGAPWGGPESRGDVSIFRYDPTYNTFAVVVAGPSVPLYRQPTAREFGYSLVLDDTRAVVGAPEGDNCCPKDDEGSIYVYNHASFSFFFEQILHPYDGRGGNWHGLGGDRFGQSVAIDGDLIAAGGPGHQSASGTSGAVYLFPWREDVMEWATRIPSIRVPGERVFGFALALDGEHLLVGGLGSSYVFPRSGSFFGQPDPLDPPAPNPSFGDSVALGPGGPLVGSPRHVEGNLGGSVGAVFEFSVGTPPPPPPPPPPPASGEIGGRVWFDEDGDGLQDSGEPGVEDVGIELLDSNGQVLANRFPNSLGEYSFSELEVGDYQIHFVTPGFQLTQPNVGSDDTIDSDADPTTGLSHVITLGEGETDNTVDAGLVLGP